MIRINFKMSLFYTEGFLLQCRDFYFSWGKTEKPNEVLTESRDLTKCTIYLFFYQWKFIVDESRLKFAICANSFCSASPKPPKPDMISLTPGIAPVAVWLFGSFLKLLPMIGGASRHGRPFTFHMQLRPGIHRHFRVSKADRPELQFLLQTFSYVVHYVRSFFWK